MVRRMRYSGFLNLTWGLILANLAIFILAQIKPTAVLILTLIPDLAASQGFWWQFLTFPYVQASFFSILFNLMALFFFAFPVEERMGSLDFIIFYHLSSWIPGLAALLGVWYLGWPSGYVLGADASILAVLLAFTVYHPREPIHLFGVLPLSPGLLVVFYAVLSVVLQFVGGGLLNLVQVGGLLIGGLYLAFRMKEKPIARVLESLRG